MVLDAGPADASGGLSGAIYGGLVAELRPPLVEALTPKDPVPPDAAAEFTAARDKALATAEQGWRQLAHAIALGVVEHLRCAEGEPPAGHAETYSSATEDGAYWPWLAGLAQALKTWATQDAGTAAGLQQALQAFFAAHPEPPATLTGVLR